MSDVEATRTRLSPMRRALVIGVVAVVVLLATALGTRLATPQYRAESSVYFGLQSGSSGSDLFQGGNFAAQQAVSYAELAQTPTVLEPVVTQLGLSTTANALAGGAVVATTLPNTSIVTIAVTDPSAQRAADIANATAQQLGVAVRQLAPRTTDNKPTMDATTIRQAIAPSTPSSPKLTTNLAAGLVAGLLLGFLLDLLLTRLGWRWLRVDGRRRLHESPRTRSTRRRSVSEDGRPVAVDPGGDGEVRPADGPGPADLDGPATEEPEAAHLPRGG